MNKGSLKLFGIVLFLLLKNAYADPLKIGSFSVITEGGPGGLTYDETAFVPKLRLEDQLVITVKYPDSKLVYSNDAQDREFERLEITSNAESGLVFRILKFDTTSYEKLNKFSELGSKMSRPLKQSLISYPWNLKKEVLGGNQIEVALRLDPKHPYSLNRITLSEFIDGLKDILKLTPDVVAQMRSVFLLDWNPESVIRLILQGPDLSSGELSEFLNLNVFNYLDEKKAFETLKPVLAKLIQENHETSKNLKKIVKILNQKLESSPVASRKLKEEYLRLLTEAKVVDLVGEIQNMNLPKLNPSQLACYGEVLKSGKKEDAENFEKTHDLAPNQLKQEANESIVRLIGILESKKNMDQAFVNQVNAEWAHIERLIRNGFQYSVSSPRETQFEFMVAEEAGYHPSQFMKALLRSNDVLRMRANTASDAANANDQRRQADEKKWHRLLNAEPKDARDRVFARWIVTLVEENQRLSDELGL